MGCKDFAWLFAVRTLHNISGNPGMYVCVTATSPIPAAADVWYARSKRYISPITIIQSGFVEF